MKKILGVLALVVLIWPVVAGADGMVIPGPLRKVSETGQKAVIWHDGKTETLILSTIFKGDATDFAWVIPVPSRPEVDKAKDELFTALDDYTKINYDDRYSGLYSAVDLGGIGSSNYAQKVTVLETKKVDIYDVSILEATDGTALRLWLEKRGYEYPETREHLLQHYIDKEWYFVAVKVSTEALGYAGNTLKSGHATPLKLEFASQEIVYPLRISGQEAITTSSKMSGIVDKNDSTVAAFGFESGQTYGWYGGNISKNEAFEGVNSYAVITRAVYSEIPGAVMTISSGRLFSDLISGTDYVLSGYYKVTGDIDGTLEIRIFNGTTNEEQKVGELISGAGWKRFEMPFTVWSKVATVSLSGLVESGQGTIYWDGIQLEKGVKATSFVAEKIPAGLIPTPTPPLDENIPVVLYVFSNHKKYLPGFETEYAGDITEGDTKRLAVNDDGKPWMEVGRTMYLTKLTKNMKQSEMVDDLIIRDAENNDPVRGVHFGFAGAARPALILIIPLLAEVIYLGYYFYRRKRKATV